MILLNYSPSDPLMLLARIGTSIPAHFSRPFSYHFNLFSRPAVSIEIILGLPMTAHPLFNTLDSLLFPNRDFSYPRRLIEVLIVFGVALAVALLVTDVALIFGLTGALACTTLSFILPALFYLKLRPRRKAWCRSRSRVGAATLLAIGAFILVSSTTVTLMDQVRAGDAAPTPSQAF